MAIPGFNAESSLSANRGFRRLGRSNRSPVDSVVPAIPYCGNCDWILDNCAKTGGRPYALCNACATGACYGPRQFPPPLGNGYYN
jgi:hypothetical protein